MAVKNKGKKIWYEILSSKEFNEVPIGETSAYDSKNIIGRIVRANLGLLARDPRSQSIQIGFEIKDVTENKAHTQIKTYSLVSSYIKRVIKVGKSKADDSFIGESKDKIKFKIKPVILTRYKVQNKVLTEIRKMVRAEVLEYLKKEDANKFISELIYKKIQKELKGKLSKIYPVSVFEFRIVQRL
jgi:ribosomal protein S3AE